MGQVLKFPPTTSPTLQRVGAGVADPLPADTQESEWHSAVVPVLTAEQRLRLEEVQFLTGSPQDEWVELDNGGLQFSERDFLALSRLHGLVGAPSLGSLTATEWHRVYLAVQTVVRQGLRALLDAPVLVRGSLWSRQGDALARFFEGVAKGAPTVLGWHTVSLTHKEKFGHLPEHR